MRSKVFRVFGASTKTFLEIWGVPAERRCAWVYPDAAEVGRDGLPHTRHDSPKAGDRCVMVRYKAHSLCYAHIKLRERLAVKRRLEETINAS